MSNDPWDYPMECGSVDPRIRFFYGAYGNPSQNCTFPQLNSPFSVLLRRFVVGTLLIHRTTPGFVWFILPIATLARAGISYHRKIVLVISARNFAFTNSTLVCNWVYPFFSFFNRVDRPTADGCPSRGNHNEQIHNSNFCLFMRSVDDRLGRDNGL